MTTTLRRPEGRYDEPRRLPRPIFYLLAGLLGLVVLGGLFGAWQTFEDRGTPYTVQGYTVVSDTSVEITFEVPLSPGGVVHCDLRARDRQGREVGHDRVQVGPQRATPVRVTRAITTSARAASAEVSGCSA